MNVSDTISPAAQASELSEPTDSSDAASRFGTVTVRESTWVFVRYADNSTEERRVTSGEAFLFRGQPVYIAVGEADGTTIIVNGRPIDARPFVTNGQIRIGKTFLGMLVAGI